MTGIEELDAVIEAYRHPAVDEVRVQNISSDPHPPFDEENDDYNYHSSPTRNHVRSIKKPKPVIINITQPFHSSSTATSLLLSHLTALAILPSSKSGEQGAVVHIDCLNTFSATALYNHTYSLIQRTTPATSPTTTAQLAKSALSHVHVIPCSSTTSLLQTLQDLPSYLLDSTAHPSTSRPLSLLIMSGLNHFTWQDRFNTELTRLEQINQYPTNPQQTQPLSTSTTTNPTNPQSDSPSLPSQLLTLINNLTSLFHTTTIYTTTPPPTSTQPTNDPTPPHQDIYTLSALLSLHPTRSGPPQFAPQMSMEECLRDRGRRMDAVRSVRYWVGAGPGGLSERGVGRMGFGMRKGGEAVGDEWVFES